MRCRVCHVYQEAMVDHQLRQRYAEAVEEDPVRLQACPGNVGPFFGLQALSFEMLRDLQNLFATRE